LFYTTNMSNDKHYHVQRLSDREFSDRDAINEFLDNEFLAHVGFIESSTQEPFVIPMGYARDGDRILLHGSTGSRMMMQIAAGAQICVTITRVDALIAARSTFNSSINYQSVMIFGTATVLKDEEKMAALEVISNGLIPGSWDYTRPITSKETAATMIVSLPLEKYSAKQRTGSSHDEDEDMNLPLWAGIIPVERTFGTPIAADYASDIPVPAHLLNRGK
jgi:nitroimidazol reductase NimA-like FMN-containing flavoprotein (pyridoxamine 5'-phosphate oxidase superfamily)